MTLRQGSTIVPGKVVNRLICTISSIFRQVPPFGKLANCLISRTPRKYCTTLIEIDIESGDTIERIKERVEEREGIPPIQQRLIFSGRQMSDDNTAASYKIESGSVLHLVLALRGGALSNPRKACTHKENPRTSG